MLVLPAIANHRLVSGQLWDLFVWFLFRWIESVRSDAVSLPPHPNWTNNA